MTTEGRPIPDAARPLPDERVATLLRSWLVATEAAPEDAHRSTSVVMDRVGGAGQRGRWWPLPDPGWRAGSRAPSPGRPRLEVLRSVTAGIFLALVGGFIMGNLLLMQSGTTPAPAVTTAPAVTEPPFETSGPVVRRDLLPGAKLTVSEIEPGVFHVLRDEVRKLSPFRGWALTAGLDGSLWGTRDWRFYEVGGQAYRSPEGHEYQPSIVAPDGTIWDWHEGDLVSFDGKHWKVHKRAEGDAMDVGLDGTVWATLPYPDKPRQQYLARLGERGWERTDVRVPRGTWPLLVNGKDEVWAVLRLAEEDASFLHRLVDGEWQRLGPAVGSVDVGADGTIWLLREPKVRLRRGVEDSTWDDILTDAEGNWLFDFEDVLMRFDGESWTEWGPADGVPSGLHSLHAAPDGSVWARTGQEDCDGLLHFDGTSWRQYLSGLCVDHVAGTPDGVLWVLAGQTPGMDEHNWYDLYAIEP